MRKAVSILMVVLLLLVLGEFLLQMSFGFTDAVLVQEDSQIEYMAKPNQELHRFGNDIRYNEYSMRSDSPIKGGIKILGLGDSVLNGGNMIDQKELATSLLSKELSRKNGKAIQVLNISYKSWGPDNALAYLNKFGHFDAELIFLVISSHDAHDIMNFEKIVGKDVNYPAEQYPLAYFELVDRYLVPKFQRQFSTKNDIHFKKDRKKVNPGLEGLIKYADNNNITIFLYLHPELKELRKGHYHNSGQLIIDFAAKNRVFIKEGILGAREQHYRDNIHLNSKGQYYLYQELSPIVEDFLKDSEVKKSHLLF